MSNDNLNLYGLTERDMDTIVRILKEYPDVKQVNIFGSRAKGNYHPGSDIDLAVINEGVTNKIIRHIKSELDESTLPYAVDILYLPEILNPDLVSHITRVGASFYEKR